LRQFLTERNIASAIYYPVPLHKQQCFAHVAAGASLPVSEQLARECLSLPIYPELTQDQLKLVVDTVSAFAINPLLRVSASIPQKA
jgi:dTDP-4-amino-4,6-dideoxygalactose transaminase